MIEQIYKLFKKNTSLVLCNYFNRAMQQVAKSQCSQNIDVVIYNCYKKNLSFYLECPVEMFSLYTLPHSLFHLGHMQ